MQNLSDTKEKLKLVHYWDKLACEIISYCLNHCDSKGRVVFTYQDFAKICGYSCEFLDDDFADVMDYINGLRFTTADGKDCDLIVFMKEQDEKYSLAFNAKLLDKEEN